VVASRLARVVGARLRGLVSLLSLRKINWWWAATLALLALFSVLPRPRLRMAIVCSLVRPPGANLFFTLGDTHVRPVKQAQVYETNRLLLESLKAVLGDARIYLSPQFLFYPA